VRCSPRPCSRSRDGSWLKEAIFNHDYPALQGRILFLAFVLRVVNLLVDISYGPINPQIRVS
jgi:peptide/nickel transport system permease protein